MAAFHARLICDGETAVAVSPLGAVGACVSVGVSVKFFVAVASAATVTEPLVGLNPLLLTFRVYVPAFTPVKLYTPDVLVVVDAPPEMATVAPEIAPPALLVTVPVMLPLGAVTVIVQVISEPNQVTPSCTSLYFSV